MARRQSHSSNSLRGDLYGRPCQRLRHHYGWIPPAADGGDEQKSITWREVQWALDAGKPVYAFMLRSDGMWDGERELDRLLKAQKDSEIDEIGHAV